MSDTSNSDTTPPAVPAEAATPSASWQEQDGLLRELWMQNKTPQDISDALGRSIPAIMTRAARLGLPRRAAPGRKPGSGMNRRPLQDGDPNAPQQRRSIVASPRAYEAPAQAAVRVCLMCLKKFESAGRHNRICAPCKGSSEYAQASTLADVHLPPS